MEGVYIIQAKFTPNNVQLTDKAQAKQMLTEAGFTEDNIAAMIVTAQALNLFSIASRLSLRNFQELIEGHNTTEGGWADATDTEKAVATKLMQFVQQNLTAEEKKLVVQMKPNTRVKEGWLERAATYCKTPQQLMRLMELVRPVDYPKGGKFAVSDTPAEKNKRLLSEAGEILTTAIAQQADDGDKKAD